MKLKDIRLSFSSLKAFGTSPAHFAHYKTRTFKTSAPMRRGKLTHTLTLEPHLRDTLKVIDCTTRAAKAYKEAAELYGEEEVYTRTEVEKHLYWQLEGVEFHGFADVIGRDYIADLKVTDNEPRKLQRWVLDNLYHMQLALYSYAEFNIHTAVKLYLITIDPNAPYGVVVYQLSADFIDDGIQLDLPSWYR